MKLFNSVVLGFLTILSLASCEMKNELTGNTSPKTEMGILELGISVKQPASQTRAGGVATNSFPVIITGASAEVADIKKEYATVEEMPSSVSLPVGKYTVTSHTPGKLEKKMSIPYYGGSTTMSITKGITTSTSVVCKMQNSRIQIKYGDDFQSAFQSWTITVDDGSNTALSFDNTDIAPSAIYWNFDESSVTAITVNIRAVTTEGNTVSESRTFKKSDASDKYEDENEFFNGGDALDINMGTVSSSTGTVSGITIKTFITFENESESVEIPVEGEEEPGGGEEGGGDNPGDGPTLTCDAFETGVSYSIEAENWPSSTNVIVSTPAKLKSLKVTIIAGNEGFQGIVEDMGFTNRELVGDTELESLLGGFGISLPMPQAGSTTYSFPISTFYALLNIYGPSVDADEVENEPDGKNDHIFQIVVEDEAGHAASNELSVTISK